MRVFGSLARGENEPGSDIDLLIELGGEQSSGGELLEVLELYDLLSALAGIRVDVVTARSLRPEVRGTCCCRGGANSEPARGVSHADSVEPAAPERGGNVAISTPGCHASANSRIGGSR